MSVQPLKLFGYILFLFLVTGMFWLGGDPWAFIDIPSYLIVIGCGLAIAILSGAIFSRTTHDRERLARWRAISVSVMMATLIGFMTGLIRLLNRINEPGYIGPPMAIVLLSCFVGIIVLSVGVLPQIDRYTKLCGNYREASLARIACFGFPIVCLFGVVLSMLILIASMGYMT